MQKDDMSIIRAAKRPRRGTDDDVELPLDLLSLYQSDIGGRILSYALGADLCTIDILSKQFNALTTDQWNIVTKDRFGMSNGKEGWKIGTSFLRRPIFVHDVSDFGDERETGSPHVAANESIVVDVSDMANGIEIRNSSTLDTINNTVSSRQVSPISNWKVAICGRTGTEIIVTSNNNKICAQRGDNATYNRQQFEFDTSSSSGIEIIGCETHLVVSHGGQIQLYEVNHEQERGPDVVTELLSLRMDIRVEEGAEDEYGAMDRRLAWGQDKLYFIVGYPHQICIWKLDAANNEITLTKTITVSDWEVTNVALSEDYIVASSKNKKVHIWERSTSNIRLYLTPSVQSQRPVRGLCDVEPDDELDHDEEVVWPLSLSCHGSILVSTSHIGCALCIWDMKTGKLLKRHNEASEEGVSEMLTTGIADVTDMAYLKMMNAFLCMGEYENMWVFPANQRQYDVAASIRNRVSEARLERENASESESEVSIDSDYVSFIDHLQYL